MKSYISDIPENREKKISITQDFITESYLATLVEN